MASDIEAYVVDATDVLFKVAAVSSGTTIGDLAQTDVGANVAGVDNTGDSVTGNSRCAISDTSATTNTLPFRIVDLVQETKNASGGFTEAYVKWNAVMRSTTLLAYMRYWLWLFHAPSYLKNSFPA